MFKAPRLTNLPVPGALMMTKGILKQDAVTPLIGTAVTLEEVTWFPVMQ